MRAIEAGLLVAMAVFSSMIAGCHSATEPPTPVDGKVSYRGSPLRGGSIVFIPDASRGSSGPLAHASIQADGSYHLETDGSPGAPAGWYRITVVAVVDSFYPGGRESVPHSILPEKYGDPDISGLACEVRPGRDNKINFNLE